MMSDTESVSQGVTMEETPSGKIVPEWLFESLLSGKRLMIIYPSESSRKATIDALYKADGFGLIDTTLHLTLKRLVSILHLDLRLPSVMDDDGILFERTHEALLRAYQDFKLTSLMSNPKARWSRSKTRRLLSLYREVSTLKNPWKWQEDPGARVCDEVLRNLGKSFNSTHPLRVERDVLDKLAMAEEPPFSISDIEGIVMLDHPTGISEVRLELLNLISRFTGVHQLVNPGSHRLGYHGEFIHDISSVASSEELPNWIPEHEIVKSADVENWKTEIGVENKTSIHRITIERESDEVLSIANIIPKLSGNTAIVSGDPQALADKLEPHLHNYGIKIGAQSKKLIQIPGIAQLLELMKISNGEEAWSLSRLVDIQEQIELPIDLSFTDLLHPKFEEWKPKLHPEVMMELARGFHLLGGKGTLSRWLSTLASASPRAGIDKSKRMQELEESQWWLAAFANWMKPILPSYDQKLDSRFNIGCSSEENLPLPTPPTNVIDWFNSLAEKISWDVLAARTSISKNSIKGLQVFYSTISKLSLEGFEFSNTDIIEVVESIVQNTEISSPRGNDSNISIMDYSQAYGLNPDTIILCGADSNKWSMKNSQVPWLDENVRMNLGLHRPDEPLRKGRHQIKHFLNCAKNVLLIDATLEDGIEFSGPLDEWVNNLIQTGDLDLLNEPPEFIHADDWHPETPNRAWEWKTIDDETRLVFRVNSMEIIDNNVITHRSGNLPRDSIQRSGTSIIEQRKPEQEPMNINGMLFSAEKEILEDQIDRRNLSPELEEGDVHPFKEAPNLIVTSGLKLLPSKYSLPNGRIATEWPHLGLQGEKHRGIPIDPRPLSPPSTQFMEIDSILGRGKSKFQPPKVWSQGRLQSWLDCPRKAWYERHKYVAKEDKLREDLAAITRGDIVHQVEESILRSHGLDEQKIPTYPVPLHLGSLKEINDAWEIALETVKQIATWMKRVDGIAAHRCRDLVGVSPKTWNEYIEGETQISIGGRLGRMIIADYALQSASPIACEWEISVGGKNFANVTLPESDLDVLINGRIDRVDEVNLPYDLVDKDAAEIIPLDFELDKPPKSKRLVVIRDIKSVDGSKDNDDHKRHMKAIFQELQLALYARAWEISNPGDRVIGVGVTTVGNNTIHRIELDPEFLQYSELLEIGKITNYTHGHYRLPGEDAESSSNPFRAWMRERITTATRVIDGVKAGNIHPEPSTDTCKYCGISDACPSAKRGDN